MSVSIRCLDCFDCGAPCVEVRLAEDNGKRYRQYPKPDPQIVRGKRVVFNEYRFYCPSCRREWLYYTKDRSAEMVREDSTEVFDPARGVLVPRKRES